MEQLTFGACVKKGWISSWQAVTQMPWLFVGVWAVFACTSLLIGQRPSNAAGAVAPAALLGHALLSLGFFALQMVVSSVLTIKVHRFVLLGEGANPLMPLNGKPLGRYLAVWLASMLIVLAAMGLTYTATRGFKLAGLVYLPVIAIYLFVSFRLILLYPSIALGGRLTLRAAWRDSRGHVWNMFGVGVVACLPLIVVAVLVGIVLGVSMPNDYSSKSLSVVEALLNVSLVVLVAASLSWLYRRYARELLAHADTAPQ